MKIPKGSIIVSEKGGILERKMATGENRKVKTRLSLPKGGIKKLEGQFKDVPDHLRDVAIQSIRKGLPISKMIQPGYGKLSVPNGAVDSALSGSHAFGSAGRPISSEQMKNRQVSKARMRGD